MLCGEQLHDKDRNFLVTCGNLFNPNESQFPALITMAKPVKRTTHTTQKRKLQMHLKKIVCMNSIPSRESVRQ